MVSFIYFRRQIEVSFSAHLMTIARFCAHLEHNLIYSINYDCSAGGSDIEQAISDITDLSLSSQLTIKHL